MPNGEKEWIQERVEGLTDGANTLQPEYNESIDNSFNDWSALKLIVHSATVNMYTKVISDYADDFFYVDALAGSGLSEYGEGECFYGSPIVAAKNAEEPFSKMYFLDDDEDRCDLLEQRLENFFSDPSRNVQEPDDWVVWSGDSNELIGDVKSDIWSQYSGEGMFNHLTFVDNQALDFYWDSMMEIGDLTGDFLVNYPGAMAVGMNMNNRAAHEGSLQDFFGRNLWDTGLSSREEYRDEYMRQLATLFEDGSHQVSVKVDSGRKSFEYDMIYATRDTNRGSGYVEAIEYVQDFVENVDGGDVGEMLELMHGDQSVMDEHLPEGDSINDELLESDDAEDRSESQSGLGEF